MRITGATATSRGASRCVVELSCDASVSGTMLAPASVAALVPALANEALAGADPRAIAANYRALCSIDERELGALGAAVGALDCAGWDLKAKLERVPLWRSIGALAPRVNAHARIGLDVADAGVAAVATALAGRGLRGCVLTSTLDAARDVARLRDTRAALGRDAALMLDLDARLVAKEAIVLVTRIERDIDLTWVESPANRADFPGLRRVSDAIRGAVSAGKAYPSVAAFLPALHARAIDIVQIDAARIGISGALMISDAAFGLELPVALAPAPADLHVQLAAALPYCASVEIDAGADWRIENGHVLAHAAVA